MCDGNNTHYGRPKGKGIKLHLGCGDYWKCDGFLNLDHAILGGTDMVLDLRERLPFQDNVVEEITSGDFIEHFTTPEIEKMLDDWHRVLIPEGKVYATVPDIEELMKQGLIQQIYGIEQDHKWGYTIESLTDLFIKHGFREVEVKKTEFTHRPGEPKLEARCIK